MASEGRKRVRNVSHVGTPGIRGEPPGGQADGGVETAHRADRSTAGGVLTSHRGKHITSPAWDPAVVEQRHRATRPENPCHNIFAGRKGL
jgi:hypothetical protein